MSRVRIDSLADLAHDVASSKLTVIVCGQDPVNAEAGLKLAQILPGPTNHSIVVIAEASEELRDEASLVVELQETEIIHTGRVTKNHTGRLGSMQFTFTKN
jgi:hypothetical protein